MTMNTTVTAYTDGACRGNQNDNAPGGYGVVLLFDDGERKEYAQGYRDTTNNRMELRAAITALSALDTGSTVTLVTDSKYVSEAFNQHWIDGWKRRGWKNASGKPVMNRDLWDELIPLTEERNVTFKWVKGHAGIPENERADELACLAADPEELIADEGPTIITEV